MCLSAVKFCKLHQRSRYPTRDLEPVENAKNIVATDPELVEYAKIILGAVPEPV
ncbi:hypothetical protein J6590_050935 [Homalodisca vitripennis]|nr:hypothetical protein J6590_050935 [Homalodisca vitripennis]